MKQIYSYIVFCHGINRINCIVSKNMFIVSFGGDFWLEVEKNELPLGAGNITHEITPYVYLNNRS